MAGPRRSREPKQGLGCHDRALLLLAVRARSRHELSTRLEHAGFDAEEVLSELARLEAVGLVDDEAFARDLARHHLTDRRSGRRAVVAALRAKGVASSTIERTLEDLEVDPEHEAGRAAALAAERAGRLRALAPEVAFHRLFSLLMRRGYDAGIARSAAAAALRIETVDG
ncbi:MAG TPA: regulatory protein RecX [Actinomycetota bacterium]|nr:regulatory protein RecX [Actinomycetota bacterium]